MVDDTVSTRRACKSAFATSCGGAAVQLGLAAGSRRRRCTSSHPRTDQCSRKDIRSFPRGGGCGGTKAEGQTRRKRALQDCRGKWTKIPKPKPSESQDGVAHMALNCTFDSGSGEDARSMADSNLPVAGTDLTELSQVHHQQIAREGEWARMKLEDITARRASDAEKWQKQVTESRWELKESEDRVTALQAQVEELQRTALQTACDSKRAQTKAENKAARDIAKLKKQVTDSNQKLKEKLTESKQTARDLERVQSKLKEETARHAGDTAEMKKQVADSGQLLRESSRREFAKLKKQAADSGQQLSESRRREAALQTQVEKLKQEAPQVSTDSAWRAELLSELEERAVEAKKEKQARAHTKVIDAKKVCDVDEFGLVSGNSELNNTQTYPTKIWSCGCQVVSGEPRGDQR